MSGMRQVVAALLISARSFPVRIRFSLIIIVALVCLTVPPLVILVMGASLRASYLNTAATDRVMILSSNSHRQVDSRIWPAWAETIARAPGVRSWHGRPLMDLQLSASFHPKKKSRPENGNARLRGIGPLGFVLRPELKLVAGRPLKAGSHEVLAGVQAARKFAGLEPGQAVVIAGASWRVVGIFRTGGNLDGDVVGDARVLKAAARRLTYDSVLLSLKSPSDLEKLQQALRALPIAAMPERHYYALLWHFVPKVAFYVAATLLFIIGGGALAATSQSVYAAVSSRKREIVILRAVGFDGYSVAVAVILETILLAWLGALIGAGIVWLWVEGYPYNGGLEGGVFRITVTSPLVLMALGWAIVVAVLGAVLPSVKAARGTVTDAMRDL
jgi:putative ABC transport system permease protein